LEPSRSGTSAPSGAGVRFASLHRRTLIPDAASGDRSRPTFGIRGASLPIVGSRRRPGRLQNKGNEPCFGNSLSAWSWPRRSPCRSPTRRKPRSRTALPPRTSPLDCCQSRTRNSSGAAGSTAGMAMAGAGLDSIGAATPGTPAWAGAAAMAGTAGPAVTTPATIPVAAIRVAIIQAAALRAAAIRVALTRA
jgi:hypothetical protein